MLLIFMNNRWAVTHIHEWPLIVLLIFMSTTQLTSLAAADTAEFQFDPVKIEIERFAYLAPETLKAYITSDGMLNHFQMFWELRDRFPLHFIVFKQVSSHIPHEANVEQYFSRAVSARAFRTAHPRRRVSLWHLIMLSPAVRCAGPAFGPEHGP